MTRIFLLTTTALLMGASVAQAQTSSDPVSTAPVSQPGQQGVLVFAPDFFTEYRPNTALDMVERVPGFSISRGDGSRGFEGAVGNILINGARPASKNDSGANVAGRTNADQVERIELVRGGANGIDMQGFTTVVNVILKSTTSRQQVVTTDAVVFDGGQDVYGASYQFTERAGERSWSVTLSDGMGMSDSNGPGRLVRTRADGVVTRDEVTVNDGYGGGQSVRATWAAPILGGKASVTGRYGVSDFQSFNLQAAPGVVRDNRNTNDSTSGEFGLVYERLLPGRLTLETRLIHEFSDFEGLSTNRTVIDAIAAPEQDFGFTGESSETIARATLRRQQSDTLTYEGGAEVAFNRRAVDQAFTVDGINVPLPSASVTVEELRGEAFAKATWRPTQTLTVDGGVRVETSTISQSGDADNEKTLTYVKPRLQLTWTPRPADQFRLRFERELGQLDFDDFAASADLRDDTQFGGNVDLVPEQRFISEATYERRFWGEGVLTLSARHDEITDAIDVIPLDRGLSAVGNIGDGTLDRLAIELTLPTDKLGIRGGRFEVESRWDRTRVTDPTTGEERPISDQRPRMIEIKYIQDIKRLKTQIGIFYLPAFDETTFDPDQRTDVHLRNYVQLFGDYKPTPTLSIHAELTLWDDFEIERTVYGDRQTRLPLFNEVRTIDPRTFVRIGVRKTF